MMSDLNMPHGKMSEFVSFILFEFALVIKQRNFDFESNINTLIGFDKKKMTSDLDKLLCCLNANAIGNKLRNTNFKLY